MDSINNFFSNLGSKMPFASDFFSRNLKVGAGEISTMFVAVLAAVVVLIAVVVIIACACHTSAAKRKIARAAFASKKAPAQNAADDRVNATIAPIAPIAPIEDEEDEEEIDIRSPVAVIHPEEEEAQPEEEETQAEPTAEQPAEQQENEEQPVEQEEEPQATEQEEAPQNEEATESQDAQEEANAQEQQQEEEEAQPEEQAEEPAEAEQQVEEQAEQLEEEAAEAEEQEQQEEQTPLEETAGEEEPQTQEEEKPQAQEEETSQEEATVTPENDEEVAPQEQEAAQEDDAGDIDITESAQDTQENAAEQTAQDVQAPFEVRFAALMASARAADDAPQKPVVPVEKTSGEAVAMEDTEMKKEESKQVSAKAEPVQEQEDKKAKKGLIGTFEVSLCLDGYRFCLYASNKQLMYESVGFTSIEGAMKGIETFRKTLQECPYIITSDKYGRFRYVFNKRYQGENYTSAASAQSAAESVKRWAENAKVIVRNPKPEEIDAYKKGLEGLRTKDDVDWDEVARVEAAERKMGKFTVEEDGNGDEVIGYRFYLIANNAQILYTSAIYTSAAGALKAIDTFKRAVYVGNFYVDVDKFGHFRYILRSNATTTYVGESYTTRARAESSIESVKKFVKCATIVPFKKTVEEE